MAAKPGNIVQVKTGTFARTDTTKKVICTLPAQSQILSIVVYGTASDAGTSAVMDIGNGTTDNAIVSGYSVKTNAGRSEVTGTAAQAAYFANKIADRITVTAKYTESGTTSTTGGPWTVVVGYI